MFRRVLRILSFLFFFFPLMFDGLSDVSLHELREYTISYICRIVSVQGVYLNNYYSNTSASSGARLL